MGTFQSIEFVGSVIGAPLGGAVASYMGMRAPLLIVAALAVAGFVLLLASIEFREKTRVGSESSSSGGELSLSGMMELFKIWGLIVVCMGSFGRNFIMQGIISTLFPLYVKSLGMDVSLTGIIMVVRSAPMRNA